MSNRRSEKVTLQIAPAILAQGKEAAALACTVSRLGGTVVSVNADQVVWSAPDECHEKVSALVAEFCRCGEPAAILVPAGDDLEGAEWECDDCTTTVVE